ncbi:MAG: hypothetical protein JNK15_02100 [Planctomycetes bacterium]|nr:hypothetical protein [Planctomycetota bacterium]
MNRFLATVLPVTFALAAVRAQQPPSADPFTTLAALPVQPAVDRGVRAVVRDAKGDPVPQALVVVTATGRSEYSDATTATATLHPGDWVLQAARIAATAGGERFALDERATTSLPRVSGYVLAWHEGKFAAKTYQVNEGQPTPRVELTLATPWTGVVEVVDHKGQPAAGVPVGIATGNSTNPRHTTDNAGRATLRNFADRVTEKSTARLLAATIERIEVAAPANGGTARLQLPECGSVHATFTGPLLPGTTLSWSLRANDRSAPPTSTGPRDATFAFVQAGYDGELQAWAGGVNVKSKASGVVAGSTLEITAARDENERYLVVRPLTTDGKPIPKGYADTRWTYEHGSSSSGAYANSEGWLEIEVPENSKDATLRLGMHGSGWATPLVGTLEFTVTASDKGRVDKGEQKVTKPEVALEGQLVDPAGKPVRGVQLYTASEHTIYAKTDDDGRFQFAVPGARPAELTVRIASSGWFFRDPVETARTVATNGQARLVVQAAGRLRFKAAGLEKGLVSNFGARIEPADGSGNDGKIDVAMSFDDEFLLLPAGHWNFVVTHNQQEVHRLDSVRVDAGVEVHDPRFMSFDWKAFASLLVVHVEDANGAPTDACTVWLRQGGGGNGRGPSNGEVRWLVTDNGSTLHVQPRDKKLSEIHLGQATGEHWVRLGAGPRLEVRVEPAPKLPANARLVAKVGARTEPLALDAAGKGVVWLEKTGDHAVQLALAIGDTTTDLPDGKRTVDVATGGSVATFPGGPALQAAIDKLAAK